MKDGLGHLADQQPRGRMQAEQLLHRVRYFGGPVFRHEPGHALGQVVFLQDLVHQVAVKDRPRAGVFRGMGLQAGPPVFRRRHVRRNRSGAKSSPRVAARPLRERPKPLPAGCIWQLMKVRARSKPCCVFIILRGSKVHFRPYAPAVRSFNYNLPQFALAAKGIPYARAAVLLGPAPCSFPRHAVLKALPPAGANNAHQEAFLQLSRARAAPVPAKEAQ